MALEPHEQRVVAEKAELDERLAKLNAFLPTETCINLPFDDRCLLAQQAIVMTQLSQILGKRIERFLAANTD